MKEARLKKILCIGAVMVDTVCHVPGLPAPGEGVVVTKREMRLGGCAFNSASIAKQLGSDCFLMAPIGNGPFATFAQDQLGKCEIDALQVDTDLDCGMCMCMVEPNGERTMVTTPGIERCFESSWFGKVDAEDFGIALASGYEIEGVGGDAIIGFLEEHPHLRFFYAPGPRVLGVSEEKMRRIVALNPTWHLNDQEAAMYAQYRLGVKLPSERGKRAFAAGEAIALEHQAEVVVTLGAGGSAVFFPDGSHSVVMTREVSPIDTVGAGDTHLGALVAARNAGLSWAEALDVANRAASVVCLVAGASLTSEQFAQAGLSL